MSWPMKKMEDIFDVARGGSPRPIDDFLTDQADGINWIMIGDTKGVGKYIEKTAKKIKPEGVSKSRVVKEGDFLLTNSMSFGRPYILKTSGCIHDGWLVLSPLSDQINTDYFYYYLGSDEMKMRLSAKAAGAVVKNLNKDIVKSLKIPLPPLASQKKIAAILDAADAHRQKTKQLLAKYDELAQSIFLEMFGDPVTNPKGWEVKKLGQLCDKILGGGTPSKAKEEYYTGDIPWVTPKDMKVDFINSSLDRITDDAISKSSVKLIPESSLLMVIRSGILKKKLPLAINECIVTLNQDMKAFIPSKMLTIEYFFYLMKAFEPYLLSKVRAVTADNIEFKQIKELDIPVPCLDDQQCFSSAVRNIKDSKALMMRGAEESEHLFNGLLQKAFKGELVK